MSRHSVEKLSKSLTVSPSTSQEITSLTTLLSSRIAWLAFLLPVFGYTGSIFAQADSIDTKRPAANPQQLPQLLPREKEIALALSAAPEHLRKGAGVYVLERSGFVKVRDSANGFTCIVNRDHPLNQKPVFRRVAPALLTCSPATFATSIRAPEKWSRFPRTSCFTHRT